MKRVRALFAAAPLIAATLAGCRASHVTTEEHRWIRPDSAIAVHPLNGRHAVELPSMDASCFLEIVPGGYEVVSIETTRHYDRRKSTLGSFSDLWTFELPPLLQPGPTVIVGTDVRAYFAHRGQYSFTASSDGPAGSVKGSIQVISRSHDGIVLDVDLTAETPFGLHELQGRYSIEITTELSPRRL